MKNIKNIFQHGLMVAVLALSSVVTFAQTRISGKVVDAKGEPVIGAVVMLRGSSAGATTDLDGNYVLVIPASAKSPELAASCIGYVESVAQVGTRAVVDFVLNEDTTELDEVVVVGYGSMRRSDLTGSVSSVKIDDNVAARATSFDQLLQGHAAGIQVTSAGGALDAGVSIKIRGTSTFNGSSEPLYVVDGVIINASQGGQTLLSQGLDNSSSDEASNGLIGLNPQDIASMEILKDASATAIYGALGANGVVLITTKSASNEKPVIRFNAGIDVSNVYKKQDVLSFDEYVGYIKGLYRDIQAEKPGMTVSSVDSILQGLYSGWETEMGENFPELTGQAHDWQDEILRTAVSQRYYLSISGRPNTLSYSFSLGYNNTNGIVKGTSLDQYTMRLNLDKTIAKKFKIGTKTNLAYVESEGTQGTGSGRMTPATSMVRSMLSFRPYISAAAADDYDDTTLTSAPTKWLDRKNFNNHRTEYRITPNVYAEYKILPWLSFKSTLGGDYRHTDRSKFKSVELTTDAEGNNGASGTYDYFVWNWDNMLIFDKKFKDHSISGTLGSSAYKTMNTDYTVSGWEIIQYMSGLDCLNNAPQSKISFNESASQTLSYFARGVYNYKDRYVVTATYRADGSSKFQGANKWAYFPSFAFAWRLSEEPWFKVNAISSAKFRLGWGRVGNQSIKNYQTLSNYSSNSIPSHDYGNTAESTKVLYPSNLANPDLRWETTEQINAGIDLGMWQGRLSFSADVYDKTTFDLLQSKTIPVSSGFQSISYNDGTIQNRGLEMTLEAVPVKTADFEWSINGNITFNRNKIVKINSDGSSKMFWTSLDKQEELVYFNGDKIGSSNYVQDFANIFLEGYPMGLFFGYKVKGILGTGETGTPLADGGAARIAGQLDYYDLNGNGYIDEDDKTIIGDPNPAFTYGFGTTFTYKRLSLSMNFYGSHGNDLLNVNRALMTDNHMPTYNMIREAYYDAWTPDNQDAKYVALGMIDLDDCRKVSDYYIEDGSYLKLQNVSLSYLVPLKQNKVVKDISFGISARNLYIWTNYSGYDPDVNSFSSVKAMGIDSSAIPSSRSFSFDVKLTF